MMREATTPNGRTVDIDLSTLPPVPDDIHTFYLPIVTKFNNCNRHRNLRPLMDTGADGNLIEEKLVVALGYPFDPTQIEKFVGLGKTEIPTMGKIKLEIWSKELDEMWTETFHIVGDQYAEHQMLLGQMFISKAGLLVRGPGGRKRRNTSHL